MKHNLKDINGHNDTVQMAHIIKRFYRTSNHAINKRAIQSCFYSYRQA